MRALKWMLVVQGEEGGGWKRFSREQFIGGVNFDAGFVIDDDEFCFVEIEHFAEFFGDL